MAEDCAEEQQRPAAAVLPAGSPLADCIGRALEAAGYSTEPVDSSVDAQVAVFLLGQPGGIEASAEYVAGLRELGVLPYLPGTRPGPLRDSTSCASVAADAVTTRCAGPGGAAGKVAVGISSPLTWACTPGRGTGSGGAFAAADAARRIPAPTSRVLLNAELSLQRASRPNGATTFIICPGLVYGAGGQELQPMWRLAWEGKPVPQFGAGTNRVPVVHAEDLAAAVVAAVTGLPEGTHILLPRVHCGPCSNAVDWHRFPAPVPLLTPYACTCHAAKYHILAEEATVTQEELTAGIANAFQPLPRQVMTEEEARSPHSALFNCCCIHIALR